MSEDDNDEGSNEPDPESEPLLEGQIIANDHSESEESSGESNGE